MKLFKLSLAAVVATGALSSVSAASLEDAIKDIDVSGFGRYRYEAFKNTTKDGTTGERTIKSKRAFHRFTLDLNFKTAIDDNFFAFIGARYDAAEQSGNRSVAAYTNTHGSANTWGPNGGWSANGRDAFGLRQYYVGYTGIENTTILLGRQTIGTFFTDDSVGTGIKVVNNSVEGLTLAAVAFDNQEQDVDQSATLQEINLSPNLRNLYGVAAIGSFDPVAFQVWYALSQNVAQVWAIDLGANFVVLDDIALKGRVDVAGTSFRNQYKRAVDTTLDTENALGNSTFVGVELGTNLYGLDITGGFLTFGKKGKLAVHTLEDKGGFITAGETLLDYTLFAGKHTAWFAKLGYNYDAYTFGYDFVYDKAKGALGYETPGNANNKYVATEHVVRAGYKYNEKLSFGGWYSYLTAKHSGGDKDKGHKVRFDARYNF